LVFKAINFDSAVVLACLYPIVKCNDWNGKIG